MSLKMTLPFLQLIISTILLSCFQDVGSFRAIRTECSYDGGDCPLNVNDRHVCREMPSDVLETYHTIQHLDLGALLCLTSAMEFNKGFTEYVEPAVLNFTAVEDHCKFVNVTLNLNFNTWSKKQEKITIAALDYGRLYYIHRLYPLAAHENDVILGLNIDLKEGYGIAFRFAVTAEDGSFTAFQCFHTVSENCLDYDEYARCGATRIHATQIPITTTPGGLPITDFYELGPDEVPHETSRTMPFVHQTTKPTRKPKPTNTIPPKRGTTRSGPTKEKTGDESVFWQAIFMSIGVVTGVAFFIIVIFIITRSKSSKREEGKRQKEVEHKTGIGPKPERFAMQEHVEDGYEVPRHLRGSQMKKKSEGAEENIYNTITDVDVHSH